MRRVCAWCKNNLGAAESPAGSEELITHGICPECAEDLRFQMGVELDEFLDSLSMPVIVLGANHRIIAGNRQAEQILKKSMDGVKGRTKGDVFECSRARMPGGCGHRRECTGCAIRRTVLETHRTGKSFENVAATIYRDSAEGRKTVQMRISTRMAGKTILLQMDQVSENADPKSPIDAAQH